MPLNDHWVNDKIGVEVKNVWSKWKWKHSILNPMRMHIKELENQ